MSRYKKPVHIPRHDEEPDFDGLVPSYDEKNIDLIIDMAHRTERKLVGGYYDARRMDVVA